MHCRDCRRDWPVALKNTFVSVADLLVAHVPRHIESLVHEFVPRLDLSLSAGEMSEIGVMFLVSVLYSFIVMFRMHGSKIDVARIMIPRAESWRTELYIYVEHFAWRSSGMKHSPSPINKRRISMMLVARRFRGSSNAKSSACRYDGYYILSDLGHPQPSPKQSQERLHSMFRRVVLPPINRGRQPSASANAELVRLWHMPAWLSQILFVVIFLALNPLACKPTRLADGCCCRWLPGYC